MITCKQMDNGFEYIEISNAKAHAKIALQGAHIFEYARHNEASLLWVSECAVFENGTAIRGGIPVCWPWFGMDGGANKPQHGFVRTAMWQLVAEGESEQNSSIILEYSGTTTTQTLWPYRFILRLHVIVGDTLKLALETQNIDTKSFKITQALHSYFSVSNIDDVSISGLENTPYFDALTQEESLQDGTITFNAETDRIYENVSWPLRLEDSTRFISIDAQNSASCIVWNPWIEKCARMSHMCKESYKNMVCIESANARNDAKILAPGESLTLTTIIA